MKLTDEILSAYIDGELGPAEKTAIDKVLQTDAQARERLDAFRTANREIGQIIGRIDELPMPAQVEELLQGDGSAEPPVVSLPDNATGSNRQPANDNRWALPIAASVALAIGVAGGFAGSDLLGTGKPNGGIPQIASLDRDSGLSVALENAASGQKVELDDRRSAEMRLSFISVDGNVCREFQIMQPGAATNMLACRMEDRQWRVEVAMPAAMPSVNDGSYETASASNENFGSVVAQMMSGEALDARQEASLRENGWVLD